MTDWAKKTITTFQSRSKAVSSGINKREKVVLLYPFLLSLYSNKCQVIMNELQSIGTTPFDMNVLQ